MLTKVTYKYQLDESHILKLNEISTIAELRNTINQVFKFIPSEYDLEMDVIGGEVLTSEDQLVRVRDHSRFGVVKLFIVGKKLEGLSKGGQNQPVEPQQKNIQLQQEKLPVNPYQNTQQNTQNLPQYTQLPAQSSPQQPHPHPTFTCTLCNKQQMQGPFYRCSVCPDVDLCEQCQSFCRHDHPFIKIRDKKYKDLRIFAVLESQMQRVHLDKQEEQQVAHCHQCEVELQEQMHQKQHKNESTLHKITDKAINTFQNIKQIFKRNILHINDNKEYEIVHDPNTNLHLKQKQNQNQNINNTHKQQLHKQQQKPQLISDQEQHEPKLCFDY